jgi:hypothetical protein
MYELRAREAAVCVGGERATRGVWDATVAEDVRAAHHGHGARYAEDVAARVQERLTAYADALGRHRTDRRV